MRLARTTRDWSFHCLVCQSKSYHSMDIQHRYCGRCHEYHPIGKLIGMTHDEMVIEVPRRLVEPSFPDVLVPLTAELRNQTWEDLDDLLGGPRV